jgi:A/G-specific adenine glycosylase
MLQQTQTSRVLQKFGPFIEAFPSFADLAAAPLGEVLAAWQGLGYNRRGLFLHRAAQQVMERYAGILPDDPTLVDDLPGIGTATAASICAFAFNRPTPFIETNIRSVYIKIFAGNRDDIDDKLLLPLVERTLARDRARDWYYALMDYGVMIKKECGNPNRRSRQYAQQSRFEGSDRQIRGEIMRFLLAKKRTHAVEICRHFSVSSERVLHILTALCDEGLLRERAGDIWIP